MLKIAEFDLLKDDSYTDEILERLQKDYATEEGIEDSRCYEVSAQGVKFRCAYTDDENMWFTCLYFLIQGAMKMHSDGM